MAHAAGHALSTGSSRARGGQSLLVTSAKELGGAGATSEVAATAGARGSHVFGGIPLASKKKRQRAKK